MESSEGELCNGGVVDRVIFSNDQIIHTKKNPVLGSLRTRFCKLVGVHPFW